MDKIMNNPRLEHIMNQMFGCLDSEMLEICCQVSEDVKNVQKDFLYSNPPKILLRIKTLN